MGVALPVRYIWIETQDAASCKWTEIFCFKERRLTADDMDNGNSIDFSNVQWTVYTDEYHPYFAPPPNFSISIELSDSSSMNTCAEDLYNWDNNRSVKIKADTITDKEFAGGFLIGSGGLLMESLIFS